MATEIAGGTAPGPAAGDRRRRGGPAASARAVPSGGGHPASACSSCPLAMMFVFSLWSTNENLDVVPVWTLENYAELLQEPDLRPDAPARRWSIGAAVTVVCLVVAFAIAYFLARYVSRRWARIALLVIIVPFWTSYLLRVYSWQAILGEKGALNQVLVGARDPAGTVAALRLQRLRDVHRADVPVHPLRRAGPVRLARALRLHPADGGPGPRGRPVAAFRHVLLPQIRPGLITACIFVFIPILGEFLTPSMVGGARGS